MMQDEIINQLDDSFRERATKPSECISFRNEEFFFIDDNEQIGHCVTVTGNGNVIDTSRLFKIVNPQNVNIAIWAVDGCFFKKGKGPEHCDCIFFNNRDF